MCDFRSSRESSGRENRCYSSKPKKYFVSQAYPATTPALTIAVGASQTFPVDAKVIDRGQVIVQLNIFGSFVAGYTASNVTYNILRDGASITQGPQYLILDPFVVPNLVNTSDVIIVDETADEGNHHYDLIITNNAVTGATAFNIDTYSFIVEVGEKRYVSSSSRCCTCPLMSKDINVNQKFTPTGTASATIAAGGTLTLPVDIVLQDPNDVQVEFNAYFLILASETPLSGNIGYEAFRDGVSITNGPQTIGDATLPALPSNLERNSDIVLIDSDVATGKHTYSFAIYNNTTANISMDNYAFVVSQNKNGIASNQLFTPINVYLAIPSTIGANTYALDVNVDVKKKGQVLVEFNANSKLLITAGQTLNVSYAIYRNNVNITNTQEFLDISTPITSEQNFDIDLIDTDAEPGLTNYQIILTNNGTGGVTFNLDTYSFIVTAG